MKQYVVDAFTDRVFHGNQAAVCVLCSDCPDQIVCTRWGSPLVLGVCETDARVGILHKNIPNMLSQITTFFGNQGLNIENLANKSRGNYAYTLLDLSHPMPHDTVERLKEIDGVIRVRRIVENK